jgi:hypothetical protein
VPGHCLRREAHSGRQGGSGGRHPWAARPSSRPSPPYTAPAVQHGVWGCIFVVSASLCGAVTSCRSPTLTIQCKAGVPFVLCWGCTLVIYMQRGTTAPASCSMGAVGCATRRGCCPAVGCGESVE